MKLSRISTYLWLIILTVMPMFSAMMSARLPSIIQDILPMLMLMFAFFSNSNKGKVRLTKRIQSCYVGWIVFLFIALIGIRNNGLGTIRIFSCILLPVLVRENREWIKRAGPVFMTILGLNVVFTYFFFFFPQFYSKVIDIYGYVPSGTSGGTAGYRAGIANHYSQNGIFISMFIILLVTLFFSKQTWEQSRVKHNRVQHNKFLFVMLLISFIALLLTAKRGVLVWSVISIIMTYLISSKRKMTKLMKLAIVALVAIGCLQILSEAVPAIGFVFERFQSVGDDTASMERFAMWKLAIEKFKSRPLFGNGFWSYRVFYEQNLADIWHLHNERYRNLDAHNVYLQVLCETGIIGVIVYLLAMGMLFFRTLKIVQRMQLLETEELRFGAMLSLCIQIFYGVYSLTGNCLYDIVFYFYALAAALTLAIDKYLKKDAKMVR